MYVGCVISRLIPLKPVKPYKEELEDLNVDIKGKKLSNEKKLDLKEKPPHQQQGSK